MSIPQTIERTTLSQLVTNEPYARKVLPFMKGAYFADKIERTVFEEIAKFVDKYQTIPTQTSLEIEVQGRKDLNEEEFKKIVAVSEEEDKCIGVICMDCNRTSYIFRMQNHPGISVFVRAFQSWNNCSFIF